jgi:hypothetical protein
MTAAESSRDSSTVEEAARRTLRGLATGERLDPMLRRLLTDAILKEDRSDRPHDPNALVSSAARAATEWIGAELREREKVVRDLLELSDALPPQPKGGPSLPDKICLLHKALEAGKIPHAFGGALAVGFYGEPRATGDIDVNVFIPSGGWADLTTSLAPLEIDIEIDERELRSNELRLDWGSTPVHLFFSCDALHTEMERDARRVPFGEDTIPLIAPEHLIIRKAILDRLKDWHDIEQILVATAPLNVEEIERWLKLMIGGEDLRSKKLSAVKSALFLD